MGKFKSKMDKINFYINNLDQNVIKKIKLKNLSLFLKSKNLNIINTLNYSLEVLNNYPKFKKKANDLDQSIKNIKFINPFFNEKDLKVIEILKRVKNIKLRSIDEDIDNNLIIKEDLNGFRFQNYLNYIIKKHDENNMIKEFYLFDNINIDNNVNIIININQIYQLGVIEKIPNENLILKYNKLIDSILDYYKNKDLSLFYNFVLEYHIKEDQKENFINILIKELENEKKLIRYFNSDFIFENLKDQPFLLPDPSIYNIYNNLDI